MLKHLYIQNFILIDEINLDFEEGFSAFTGETGAGKSILIDAISTLSISRASSSLISKGKDKAIIEATFDITSDKHACNVMKESGFDINDETTFTREIHSNGKSVSRIDHRVVTSSLMKDILKNQIDIHGQRDNAYLLDINTHIHLLDEYLNDESLVLEVENAYYDYDSLCKEKEKALSESYNESDAEFFSYQINEINNANLKSGEDEELEQKEKQYKLLKDSLDKLSSIFDLYDNEVSNNLYELNKRVSSLKSDDQIDMIQNTINDSYYSICDAMDQLRSFLNNMDISEEDVNTMEERIFEIQKLKRKYGRTIEDIFVKRDELQSQIEMITHKQEYLDQIDQKINISLNKYEKLASKLSKIRKEGSVKLDKEIQVHLNDLMLPNAKFFTNITESKPSKDGSDHVEFLISMNKGEDLKPLNKSASGGELSRLMLGLKIIFTHLQGIETVIFDEIDTGVSGPVASSIGMKMKLLSKDTQVFSVTHLAQVAACADHHYYVSKNDSNDITHSTVKLLNKDEIIEQLALISSGEVTKASLSAAKELYKRNQK